MAARRATITVAIDLARGSKEAHMVTIEKIAQQLGQEVTAAFEAKGYTVAKATVNTVLHYVRHNKTVVLIEAGKVAKRHLRRVG